MAKKLSVYLPDDLWERAERIGTPKGEKLNASALVQHALESMLQERHARTAALGAGAVFDRERFEAVLGGLLSQARGDFERGYDCGLELVELLGFDALGSIFDEEGIDVSLVEFWLDFDEPKHNEWWLSYADRFDRDFRQYEAFRAGAFKAAADVWNALRSRGWGVPTEAEASSLVSDDGADASKETES